MALLSIQINHHAGAPKHNNYKRHDKLGYSSICYIGSKIGMGVNDKEVYKFFTLTDRASTVPSNISGCQSGTWSAEKKKDQRNIYIAPMRKHMP